MRRLWSSLLSALLAVSLLALSAAPALAEIRGTDYVGSTTVTDRKLTVTEAPTIDASYGILVDAEGNVLWSRGADKRSAMASITKIMTAVVTLENASLEDTYTVSAAAASVGESSAGLAQETPSPSTSCSAACSYTPATTQASSWPRAWPAASTPSST